jgi:LmbE family N-acetylglucosaminyl deacetylase
MAKIVAIGAHPDDIEFYAGAMLIKLAAEGNEVVFVVVTNGERSADGLKRKYEQERASEMVGIKKTIYLEFPDGQLEYQVKELKQSLLKIFLEEKPKIIFSFDPHNQFVVHKDFHPDHRALATAVVDVALIDATLAGLKRPKFWLYNPYKPNKKHYCRLHTSKKFLAVKAHKTQKLESPAKVEKFRVY